MRARVIILMLLITTFFATVDDATAQTRMSIEGGYVKPTSGFADLVDSGAWYAIRAEHQSTNALSQVAVLSYFLQAGLATFNLDSAAEAALIASSSSTDINYYELTVGARVYASAMPVFFSAAAGWGQYDPPGGDKTSGFVPTVGVGVSHSLTNFVLEFEARAHLAMIDEKGVEDPTFLSFSAAVGLPF